jgi:multimeric flavodoxin WrbA
VSADAKSFLDRWLYEYMASEHVHLGFVDDVTAALKHDAQREGIACHELEAAAGGDIAAYVGAEMRRLSSQQ